MRGRSQLLRAGAAVLCGAGLLTVMASLVLECGLSGTGASVTVDTVLFALRHVGSSRTRDQTCAPCIGRRTRFPRTTREACPVLV